MKRMWVAALLLFLLAQPCFGLSHGVFHRARTTDPGNLYGGGYVIFWKHVVALMGQMRMGFASDIEGGMKLAVDLHDNWTRVTVGADGQLMFLESKKELPINISGVAELDLSFGEHFTGLEIGLGGLIDGKIKMQHGRSVCPQGGLLVIYNRGTYHGVTDTETDIVLSGGVVLQITEMTEFLAELRLGDETSIGIGLNFR